MRTINLNIVLDRLICHDEGDGSGNAEPFIWAIFFKVDADTAHFNLGGLVGKRDPNKPVQVQFSRGSHGNLSSHVIDIERDGMDAGDNIPIPGDVGFWSGTLRSTSIPNFQEVGAPPLEIPGIAGVFFVLLEEDAVTSGASEQGHQALNRYFDEQINDFALNLQLGQVIAEAGRIRNTSRPTVAEIMQVLRRRIVEFKERSVAAGMALVRSTIKAHLSFPDIVAAGLDPDDVFGNHIVFYNQSEMIANGHRTFQTTLPVQQASMGGGGLELASDGVFTINGYFHASPHEATVIINDIPQGVRELYIDSTLKYVRGIPNKSFIRAIGGTHQGKPFVIDRFRAMQLIRSGEMRFFIRSAHGGPDGRIEIQAHAAGPNQRFDYLKTEVNDTKEDNLWSLPDCIMTYLEQ